MYAAPPIYHLDTANPPSMEESEFEVRELHTISETAINDLQNDTKKDNELRELLKDILSRWLESVRRNKQNKNLF